MAHARVLVVEDDVDINGIVAECLAKAGYAHTQAFSGSEAKMLLDANAQTPFDLVICDLMLPGLTGEELVAHIRERGGYLPIIVISARGAASDKVDLLKLGADDYLSKPFDLDELVARVEVQLRHRRGTTSAAAAKTDGQDALLRFRSWTLDPAGRVFCVDGMPIGLTRIEFNLIETLMRHPSRVFSKQELFEQAWGEPYAADDNTVTAHISNIRIKLRDTGAVDYIKTVWGIGFKLTSN